MSYSTETIRNVCLLGHSGSGKTALAESMLFATGAIDRMGRVPDGNTVCDYDAEEIKRGVSISLTMAPVKYKDVKINLLDTPGNFDFAGEALSGIRAAECALLVCGAKDGLSVGAERAWKMLGSKPRMIFINRTDEDNSDYNACLDALKAKFGTAVAPIVVPVLDGDKKVTGIVDLLHNKAYEVKGGKTVSCAIPAAVADDKIKKKDGDLSIAVERTPDILGTIGPKKKGQFLCGFSMETRDMLANSSAKLEKKNLDMVVANNLKVAGAGFGVDTNVVTFITPDGARELPLMSKDDVADAILDEILKRRK